MVVHASHRGYKGVSGSPEVDHKSAYFMVEWEISEKWTVAFEDRYVDESFRSVQAELQFLYQPRVRHLCRWLHCPGYFRSWMNRTPDNAPYDARCTWDQFDQFRRPGLVELAGPDSVKDLYDSAEERFEWRPYRCVVARLSVVCAGMMIPGHSGTCNPQKIDDPGNPDDGELERTPLGIDPELCAIRQYRRHRRVPATTRRK